MSLTHLSHHVLLLAAVALLTLAVACGDDDDEPSAEELREVEELARQVAESDGSNADFFFAHVTDNLIETVLFSTRDNCMAAPVECIGEPASILSISSTEIEGDSAHVIAVSSIGALDIGLMRQDGEWTVDSLAAASDEIPSGATSVDLALSEFAFDFDQADIPDGGNIAFRVRNVGAQVHEVAVVAIAEGATLEESLEAVFAEQAAPVGLKVFIVPGQTVDMAFEAPLAPGKYALVCFFPDTSDPNFTAHIEKGMLAEFEVE
jgi:hypothetical protein